MRATIHPGRLNLLMDHLQLGLRPADHPPADLPPFYLSLYVIGWSREMGAGHVALVRRRPPDGRLTATTGRDNFDQVLSDNPDLARRLCAGLRAVGYARVDVTGDPRPATFTRSPVARIDHVRYQVSAIGLEIDAHWEGVGEPTFAYGPAPQRPEEQAIWSVLFEAQDAAATINGRTIEGRPYAMEHWTEWLGRPLSSAHIARNEILVDLPGLADEPAETPAAGTGMGVEDTAGPGETASEPEVAQG